MVGATRDLDEALRTRIVAALETAKAPERWLRLVTDAVALEAEDEARARRKAESHRQGLILGGLVTTTVGVGMGAALGLIAGGNAWALGLIVAPLGLVLAGAGYRMKPGASR